LAGRLQVILVSPEMTLQTPFRQILSNPKFSKTLLAVCVDECYCITQFGEKFRHDYSKLKTIRSLAPLHVPFLATSATLTSDDLKAVRQSLEIETSNSYHINLGNDRPNIEWMYYKSCREQSGFEDLRQFLLPADRDTLPRSMVFFNKTATCRAARQWFESQVPDHLKDRSQYFESIRTVYGKQRTWEDFRNGLIDVLFTTEAAGMIRFQFYLLVTIYDCRYSARL
jgi:superfamily II DNA helicase RecQ